MRKLVFVGAAIAVLAGAVGARPYTIDDLLVTEEIGAAGFSPGERWLVAEHRGPYRSAPAFDGWELSHRLATDLLLVNVAAGADSVRRLTRPADAGLLAGPFSPDGSRLAVIRASALGAEAGVLDVGSGTIRWLDVSPQLTLHGQALAWRSPTELLVIGRDDATPPPALTGAAVAEAQAMRLRLAAGAGGRSAAVTGSGRFTPHRLDPAQSVVRIDFVTGRKTVLARGVFDDMELSPSGRYLALIARGDDRSPYPGELFRGAEALVRRELRILDLETGELRAPAPNQDLSVTLLTWSPKVDQLLVQPVARADRPLAVLKVDASTARVASLTSTGDPQPVAVPILGLTSVAVTWLGATPALYARSRTGERPAWFVLEPKGWRNITGSLEGVSGSPQAASDQAIYFSASNGGVLRVDREGRSSMNEGDAPSPPLGDNARRSARPTRLSTDRIEAKATPAPRNDGETLASAGRTSVRVHRAPDGDRLELITQERAAEPFLQINSHLKEVDLSAAIAVEHGPAASRRTSWLYRPVGIDAAPLVVMPYPGATYRAPPNFASGHRMSPLNNVQVLTGAGFAVLVPSLPPLPGPADPDAIASQLDEAVSAALAQGSLDADRIALWGHSFGGYATLAVATRSHRYRAYIASAATSDMGASWARLSLSQSATPQPGLSLVGAGWAENGQVKLGAPPWAARDLYIEASPFYAADRVSAPVLFLHGDVDTTPIGQAQAMFNALQRQGKDAQLVTYFGEGHVIASPENLRDLYGRIIAFLEATLNAPQGRTARSTKPTTPAATSR